MLITFIEGMLKKMFSVVNDTIQRIIMLLGIVIVSGLVRRKFMLNFNGLESQEFKCMG